MNPKLELEQIIGDILGTKKLIITAAGLSGLGRKSNDGVTYFGSKSKNIMNSKVDFELNIESEIPKTLTSPYIFMIYFRKEEQKFYIKSLLSKTKDEQHSLPLINYQVIQPYVRL